MKPSTSDRHQQIVADAAATYRQRGYRVVVHPEQESLPTFLRGYMPDLIAYGSDETVVVEVKLDTEQAASEHYGRLVEALRHQPGWRFSLVVAREGEMVLPDASLMNAETIETQIARAEQLAESGASDAAFVLLWVATEALLRRLAVSEGLPVERTPSLALIRELYSEGVISMDDYHTVESALAVRNALVHGFIDDGAEAAVAPIRALAHRLLDELLRDGTKEVNQIAS